MPKKIKKTKFVQLNLLDAPDWQVRGVDEEVSQSAVGATQLQSVANTNVALDYSSASAASTPMARVPCIEVPCLSIGREKLEHCSPLEEGTDAGGSLGHATVPSQVRVGEHLPLVEPSNDIQPVPLAERSCKSGNGLRRQYNHKPLPLLFDEPAPISIARSTKGFLVDASTASSSVIEEADHLKQLIATALEGDRDQLTMVETIMRLDDLSLTRIVERGLSWMTERLGQGLPDRRTGNMRSIVQPDHKARRVFYCLTRLKQSDEGAPVLPDIDFTPPEAVLSPMRLDEEPAAFKAGIQEWGIVSKQERGRETGEGIALDDPTRHTYVENARLMGGAAKELGFVDDSFSLKVLGSRDFAKPVFALLDRLFEPSNVASMVSALTRMNIDLFGDDPDHAENIRFLRDEAAARFPSQGLSEKACMRYEDLLSDPLKMSTIMDAPPAMMARADADSLRPADRVGRVARAFVAQLKLESVALKTTQAAELDADVHLRREGSVLLLRLPDTRERGRFRWDPCTPAAVTLFTEWLQLKEDHKIPGSLFFPSHHDPAKPQETRVAMAALYKDFEMVTKEHLTFNEIKTLRLYKAIKRHPSKLRQLAEAAGLKDPRSLARRFDVLLTRRRVRKAA